MELVGEHQHIFVEWKCRPGGLPHRHGDRHLHPHAIPIATVTLLSLSLSLNLPSCSPFQALTLAPALNLGRLPLHVPRHGISAGDECPDAGAADRDRAARTTDYNNPNTLLTLRHSRPDTKGTKHKA